MNPWRRLLVACSLLLIAIATLTPGPLSNPGGTPGLWCLACGATGGADVTTNVLLFMPLGAALVLCGTAPLHAAAGGMLLSVLIESAQHTSIVPARVANITDVLSNGLGTALGGLLARYWRTWLLPERQRAATLASATGIGVTALLSFTAWALQADVRATPPELARGAVAEPLRVSSLPFTPGYGWYHGRVLEGLVNGVRFQRTGDGPLILTGNTGLRLRARVSVAGHDERTGFTPMLYVHRDGDSTPQLMLGQQGSAVRLTVALRGNRLHLAAPDVLLPAAFSDSWPVRVFSAVVEPGRWAVEAEQGGVIRRAGFRLTLSLGWALFQTVIGTSGALLLAMSCLWLFTLFMPLGYLRAWCPAGASGALMVGSMLPAFALLFAPLAASIARTSPRDAICALAGYGFGLLVGHLVQRRHASAQR